MFAPGKTQTDVSIKQHSDASTEQLAWLRLLRDRRWSRKQKHHLLKVCRSAEHIYAHSTTALREIVTDRWPSRAAQIDSAKLAADALWLEQDNCHLITLNQAAYPTQLKQICDPPLALFAQGDIACLADPSVAVVGSRRPTPLGKKITENIAVELANLGIVVTSGMALGIDAAAHLATLSAGGKTVAVMGCGLDQIYPSQHRKLFNDIAEQGCLLSEYPLGVPATKQNFPQRNRIVCGLALGTLIVEAAARSGTLITARLTMETNRPLMVIPGSPLNPQYAGSLELLRDGATPIRDAHDVLLELQLPLQEVLTNLPDDSAESTRLATLEPDIARALTSVNYEPTTVDEIISTSGLTASQVSSMLLTLEVEGLVAVTDDGGYVRID